MARLNKDYALSCKGILDFGGLGFDGKELNFSDIDGIHTTEKTKIVIEEKFHWYCYSKDIYFIKQEIDFDKRPSILLLTKNPKDIKNLPYEEKIIEMEKSTVLETYDNTGGRFENFLLNRGLKLNFLCGNCGINTFLMLWYQYLDFVDYVSNA